MTRTSYIGALTALLATIGAAALVLAMVASAGARPAQAQEDTTDTTTDTASGTTITVSTKADEDKKDEDCSLREAIKAANTNQKVDRCRAGSATGKDSIRFDLGSSARTITLDQALGELGVTDSAGLVIDGGAKGDVTVSGNDAVRVFFVGEGAKLALRNLTVAHGYITPGLGAYPGGGLRNLGTTEITNSTFSDNRANNYHSGGIDNQGTLTVSKSTFSRNSADGLGYNAGAIFNRPSGTLTVSKSTFSKNSAHRGGAIVNRGTAEVKNSTFSKNSARFRGGGIDNEGNHMYPASLTVSNSTFSENSAADSGGGLYTWGGSATLSNTIIANSTSGGNCNKEGQSENVLITDGGYNIEDQNTCGFDASTTTSKADTDPLLSPKGLQNNGGPTKTIGLLSTSPAKNAIPKATNGCGTEITRDQRGVKRPQWAKCDIGAFEKKKR